MKSLLKSTLGRRFSLNLLGYGYSQLLTLLMQLALVPFFLKAWGTQLYAEWLVLTGIPTLLTLLDMGVAQASSTKATMEVASVRLAEGRATLQTSFIFSLAVGLGLIILVSLCGTWIDLEALFRLQLISDETAHQLLVIMTIGLAFHLLGGPLEAWFRAVNKTALGAFWLANRRLADIVYSIACLMTGGGVLTLAGGLMMLNGVMVVVCFLIAAKVSFFPVVGIRAASLANLISVIRPGMAYLCFPIAQAITLQGSVQLLNQIADPRTVVAFSMMRTLVRLLLQVGMIVNYAIKPELSRLLGEGETIAARRFVQKVALATYVMVGASFLLLMLTGPWILTRWSGGTVTASIIQIATVSLHAVLNILWFVPASYLVASNSHTRLASWYLLSTLMALGIALLLANIVSPLITASLLLAIPELLTALLMMKLYLVQRTESKARALAV